MRFIGSIRLEVVALYAFAYLTTVHQPGDTHTHTHGIDVFTINVNIVRMVINS